MIHEEKSVLPDGPMERAKSNATLRKAAGRGDADAVRRLLPSANPLAADPQGTTALMMVGMPKDSESGALECLALLLPVSDPDAVDSLGRTALMRAVESGMLETARALASSSDLERKSPGGFTALMAAATAPGEMSTMLLALGADPAARSDFGMTAFMLASYRGNKDAVEALFPVSDVFATNSEGASALDFALKGEKTAREQAEKNPMSNLLARPSKLKYQRLPDFHAWFARRLEQETLSQIVNEADAVANCSSANPAAPTRLKPRAL